jgi:hypothetical protein
VKWFRSNIRHGSRLALFALAIQSALSFGHFHEIIKAPPAIQSAVSQPAAARATDAAATVTADWSVQRQAPAPNRDPDRQSNDGCAICGVVAMASTVLFAAPPLLQLPEAVAFLHRTTDAGFIHLQAVRVAFQPRAPPIS